MNLALNSWQKIKFKKKKKTMAPQADESKTLLPHRNAALGLNITQIF